MIPLARPSIGAREEELILGTLRSGRLSLGPRLASFEAAFAAATGTSHVSAVSSGTAGLHLAIRAAGIVDAVFVPPFPNDSGSALGMACTLMFSETAARSLDWSVYSGPKVVISDPLPGWNVRRCSPADCGRLLHDVRGFAGVSG